MKMSSTKQKEIDFSFKPHDKLQQPQRQPRKQQLRRSKVLAVTDFRPILNLKKGLIS